jgi:hypothetical protein
MSATNILKRAELQLRTTNFRMTFNQKMKKKFIKFRKLFTPVIV